MATIIKNGSVIKADFSGFEKRDVFIENGLITDSIKGDAEVIDAEGKYVLPGLIDIHNHGALGIAYSDTEADISAALKYCASEGITSVLPTLYVNSVANLILQIEAIKEKAKANPEGASIAGIHIEGPFISDKKIGAMRRPADRPAKDAFMKLIDAGEGLIKVVTLAPEVENACEIAKAGRELGVRISLGHTDATYSEAMAVIEAGATGATHTFNAMRPLNHREAGILGAVLTEDAVSCEVICDLLHLSEATVKLIYRAKGADGFVLVSDNIPPAGLPDGDYTVDGIVNTVKDGVCTVNEGKTIAGSIRSQAFGAKNLIKLGIPLNEVSKMGSYTPARAIGIDGEVGSIAIGKRADIIIVDGDFSVEKTIVGGKIFK